MTPETEARVQAFRRALELAAGERSGEPVPSAWHNCLKDFPHGCCELASQTLAKYLKEDGSNLRPYIIGTAWTEGSGAHSQDHGHVIVALDGDYIDLTLDQFDGYDDWIVAEPIESGRQLSTFMQEVRNQGGTFTTRELTFDGIPDQAWKLYDWLKNTADRLLAASGHDKKSGGMPQLVSMDILPQYRDKTVAGQSDKGAKKQTRQTMTHEGTMTYCYQPSQVRLRETRTQWVSECGLRFRKDTGAAVGSGVWSSHRLELSSIRKIHPDD